MHLSTLTFSPPGPLWILSSADAVQPSFVVQVGVHGLQPSANPYLLGLHNLTQKVRRGEPAQMGTLQEHVEEALARPQAPESVGAWAKRMAVYLARR